MGDEHARDDDAVPGLIGRRQLLGGTVALAACGLSGGSVLTQAAAPASDATVTAAAAGNDAQNALDAHTRRMLRWGGPSPANWVRARGGADHNVVIVGAGQSGVALAYGLARKGVGQVSVIDKADPGQAGIWLSTARMQQLRTPKTMAGPEDGNFALSFRAWFETLHGPEAFDAMDRIPTPVWAQYLSWFQQTSGVQPRYRTRLVEIEPAGELLRLHLETDGKRLVETTRKLVLANGFAGAGGPNLPDFVRALPQHLWSHTSQAVPFGELRNKTVGVIGAGSSAFDAAAVALESGATEVHMFNLRPHIEYQGRPPGSTVAAAPPADRGHANVLGLAHLLPDVVRWRNFVRGERQVASVPLDSLDRATAFDNFRIHLATALEDVQVGRNGRISARARQQNITLDHLICGTGYRVDLAAQPELARIHPAIALWGDRHQAAAGEQSAAGSRHPYLGPSFEFVPKQPDAAYLRNVHCFNIAAALSFGLPVGDVPSMTCHPLIIDQIVRDLYVASVDVETNARYLDTPAAPQDPAPYQHRVAQTA